MERSVITSIVYIADSSTVMLHVHRVLVYVYVTANVYTVRIIQNIVHKIFSRTYVLCSGVRYVT